MDSTFVVESKSAHRIERTHSSFLGTVPEVKMVCLLSYSKATSKISSHQQLARGITTYNAEVLLLRRARITSNSLMAAAVLLRI